MKHPRRTNTYCPRCHEHCEHHVEQVRRGPESGDREGHRKARAGKKGIGNSGRYSQPPAGQKPSQKVHLRFTCRACGHAHQRSLPRSRQFELHE